MFTKNTRLVRISQNKVSVWVSRANGLQNNVFSISKHVKDKNHLRVIGFILSIRVPKQQNYKSKSWEPLFFNN